jgi:hypothetical protein
LGRGIRCSLRIRRQGIGVSLADRWAAGYLSGPRVRGSAGRGVRYRSTLHPGVFRMEDVLHPDPRWVDHQGSFIHSETFPLSDVDLIQHMNGTGRSGNLVYIRHGNKILLTVNRDLVGYEDLLGFLREYARHHHLIFATRDDWGEWTQEPSRQVGGNEPHL